MDYRGPPLSGFLEQEYYVVPVKVVVQVRVWESLALGEELWPVHLSLEKQRGVGEFLEPPMPLAGFWAGTIFVAHHMPSRRWTQGYCVEYNGDSSNLKLT